MLSATLASAASTWTTAPSLQTAREYHTATLLGSGKVLVAGGDSSAGSLAGTELFDPATNTWTAAGTITKGRYQHTATLLPNGKVLIAGGFNSKTGFLANAELFDPATNTWTAAGAFATARAGHTATLLNNGKVLLTGGYNGSYLANAELYDPASNTWTAAGTLTSARYTHTATLLPDGKVLLAGGNNGSVHGYLASTELYDPSTNAWTAAGTLASSRQRHTATLLSSGDVLVAGGYNGNYLGSAELYHPANNTWTTAGALAAPRDEHTATLLTNGTVLVAGGWNNAAGLLAGAELYDATSNTWVAAGTLATEREWHTATLLSNGAVLVAGGSGYTDSLASAELFLASPIANFATDTTTSPMTGLWWNPNESGWSLSIEQQGPIMFIGWYTYDQAGNSTRYFMSNCAVSGNGCTGSIYRISGGAAPTATWTGHEPVTTVGIGTLSFSDTNNGVFNFVLDGVSGSKNIVRNVFGATVVPPAIDYTALWWNPNESGWGVFVSHQSPNMFAVLFTYDASGNPMRYVASNCAVSANGNGCTGTLYKTSGGSAPTVPWAGPITLTAVGTITFTFTNGSNGTMSFTIDGQAGSKAISKMVFYTPPA